MKAMPFRLAVSLLVVSLASAPTSAQSAAQTQQKADQEDEFLKGVYLPDTPDLVSPVVVSKQSPTYPSAAMGANIQGDVMLQAVVQADGRVGRVRVTTSLDTIYGLDESAIASVKQWQFKPGKLNDSTVPAVVTIQVSFRIYSCDVSGCTGMGLLPFKTILRKLNLKCCK